MITTNTVKLWIRELSIIDKQYKKLDRPKKIKTLTTLLNKEKATELVDLIMMIEETKPLSIR